MRRTRLKRKASLRKMSPRRRMEVDLDRAARLACLMSAGGRCERCGGSDGRLEWHHVIGRRCRALRWRPENALALCVACHRWWHAHPQVALRWFAETFGVARLAFLRKLRNGDG